MRRLELALAIGDHDECTNRLGPPRDQANDVERRLVGPVHVLDHRDRRPHGAHLLEQRQEDGMRLLALVTRKPGMHPPGSPPCRPEDRAAAASRARRTPPTARASPAARVSQNRRTSVLLPMPASPETSTSLPPPEATSSKLSSSASRNAERSSRPPSAPAYSATGPMAGIVRRPTSEIKLDRRSAASVRGRAAHAARPRRTELESDASSQPNACTRGSMLAYRPSGFGYQIQTCIVTSAGCQKLNAAPDCGLVCGQASVLGSGTKVPSL